MPPFGRGDRVYVRLPDGSGFLFKNVTVVRVAPDGTQTAQADEVERWDLEGVAAPANEEEQCPQ